MIGPIIPAKGIAVLRVADLTVRIMCVVPGPRIIAHCVIYGAYCKKTCLKCQAKYTVVPNQRHKCGYAKCLVCHEWVSINDH